MLLLTNELFGADKTPSGDHLDGCLYYMDGTVIGWSDTQWEAEARAMRAAGFHHIIVSGVADAALAVASASTQPSQTATSPTTEIPADTTANTSPLIACDRLVRAAHREQLRVYLALWSHPLWYGRWNLTEEVDANRRVIALLAQRFASSPAFAGWYIPHEIYVMWDAQGRYMRDLYRELSKLCKSATPGKTVILSPFFILDHEGWLGAFRYAEPKEYEDFWADLLAQTQIDVVALQDSGEHLSCYTMDQRRPFLAAMRNACRRAGKQFWINIETGELDVASYEDFARRFGRGTSVNDAKTARFWGAVSPEQLQQKLRLAHEFTDTTITWGYREYWDPLRGEAPQRVYESFRKPHASSRPATMPPR